MKLCKAVPCSTDCANTHIFESFILHCNWHNVLYTLQNDIKYQFIQIKGKPTDESLLFVLVRLLCHILFVLY